jgi:hypothetical protein
VEKEVIYVSPSNEQIDECAKDICERLGQKLSPTYNTPEMRYELAAFLKVSADIYAKHLTKRAHNVVSVDDEKENQSK